MGSPRDERRATHPSSLKGVVEMTAKALGFLRRRGTRSCNASAGSRVGGMEGLYVTG
jgi:hypothetical protein